MEENKKINLSAMMKKPLEKETFLEWDNTSSKKWSNIVKKAWVTINIGAIKSDKKEEEIIVEQVVEEIKDEKTLFYESLTSKVLKDDPKKSTVSQNKKKINIKSLKKTDNEKKDKNDIEDKIVCEKINDEQWNTSEVCKVSNKITSKKEEKNLFLNYEGDYKKKESKIIDTIHKLKKLADVKKLTKTNKIFVVSIMMATVLWISFLFYVDPETHSLENYKASILTLAGKEVSHQELIDHQIDIEEEIQWQLNQNNLWWYEVNFEILTNDLWVAIYKFDGIEYNSKEYLDAAITDKLQILKKDKIKDYLKNKIEFPY